MNYEEFMIAKTLLSTPVERICQTFFKFDKSGTLLFNF